MCHISNKFQGISYNLQKIVLKKLNYCESKVTHTLRSPPVAFFKDISRHVDVLHHGKLQKDVSLSMAVVQFRWNK